MPSQFDGLTVHQKRDLVALAKGPILVECISQAATEQDVEVLRHAFESGAFAYATPGDEERRKPIFHEDEDPVVAALACVVYGAERRHDDEGIVAGATLLASSKLIVSNGFRELFREVCRAYVESFETEVASLAKRGFAASEEMDSRYRTTLAVLSGAAAAFDDEVAFRLLDKDLTIHAPPMLHPSILGPFYGPAYRFEPEDRGSSWSLHIPYTSAAVVFNARECLAYMAERNLFGMDATVCELHKVAKPIVDDQVRKLNALEAFDLDIIGLDAGIFADVVRALKANPLQDQKHVDLCATKICARAIEDHNLAMQDASFEAGVQSKHPRSLAETAISCCDFGFLERLRPHITWQPEGTSRHLMEIMARQGWTNPSTSKDACFMKMLDWVVEDGALEQLFQYRRLKGKVEVGYSVADHVVDAGLGGSLLKMFELGLDPHDTNARGETVIGRLEGAVASGTAGSRGEARAQTLQMYRSWRARQAAIEALDTLEPGPAP